MIRTALYCLAFFIILPVEGQENVANGQSVNNRKGIDSIAQLLAEAPSVQEVQLAPNGSAVVYSVARGSVADNQVVTDLYLQHLTSRGTAEGAPTLLAKRTGSDGTTLLAPAPAIFMPRWCPRGDCITYFDSVASGIDGDYRTLMLYHIVTGRSIPVTIKGKIRDIDITSFGSDYVLSPSGAQIAFTAPIGTVLDKRHGINVFVDWNYWGLPEDRKGLFVFNMATGVVTQVSPDSLNVMWGFSWSPDEKAVVFTATPPGHQGIPWNNLDLFVVSLVSHTAQALVVQPGRDAYPTWSPDGKWIAFMSMAGELNGNSSLAMVPSMGGKAIYMADKNAPGLGTQWGIFTPVWSPDSKSVYFAAMSNLTHQLYKVTVPPSTAPSIVPTLKAQHITLTRDDGMVYQHNIHISADTRWVAWAREVGDSPSDLYLRAIALDNKDIAQPRRLTQFSVGFPMKGLVRVDTLSWFTPGDSFTIRGVLATPAAAWLGRQVIKPLPTLVNVKGCAPAAELGDTFCALPFVARGYAVFIPQVRGSGGDIDRISDYTRLGSSYIRRPLNDILAGVDLLIKRGIADSTRLGLYGFSQGGTRTAGMITMTNRFRAAVVHEAAQAELLSIHFAGTASAEWMTSYSYQVSGDIYDPEYRARVEQESPIYNLNRVKTPTLLLFGVHSMASKVGRPLFNGLQRFGIPSEFVVYDESHGFKRPAAVADLYSRQIAWFDYWLRDMPYPDSARQLEYDSWRVAPAKPHG